MDKPTKTFGLADPMAVLLKLEFDLERLKAAQYTRDQQYAALDCSIWAFHMIDWVLNAISNDDHVRLTGYARNNGKAIDGFITTNEKRLPLLNVCKQIALTSKHRVLTRTRDDPDLLTSHSIEFDPPFDGPTWEGAARAVAYLRVESTGEQVEAYHFFEGVVAQWRGFLKSEKLFDWSYGYEPE